MGKNGERGRKRATPIKVAIAPICVGGAANCLIKDHATPACHTTEKKVKGNIEFQIRFSKTIDTISYNMTTRITFHTLKRYTIRILTYSIKKHQKCDAKTWKLKNLEIKKRENQKLLN